MADTGDLKSPGGDSVRVRIPLPAPSMIKITIDKGKHYKRTYYSIEFRPFMIDFINYLVQLINKWDDFWDTVDKEKLYKWFIEPTM